MSQKISRHRCRPDLGAIESKPGNCIYRASPIPANDEPPESPDTEPLIDAAYEYQDLSDPEFVSSCRDELERMVRDDLAVIDDLLRTALAAQSQGHIQGGYAVSRMGNAMGSVIVEIRDRLARAEVERRFP